MTYSVRVHDVELIAQHTRRFLGQLWPLHRQRDPSTPGLPPRVMIVVRAGGSLLAIYKNWCKFVLRLLSALF